MFAFTQQPFAPHIFFFFFPTRLCRAGPSLSDKKFEKQNFLPQQTAAIYFFSFFVCYTFKGGKGEAGIFSLRGGREGGAREKRDGKAPNTPEKKTTKKHDASFLVKKTEAAAQLWDKSAPANPQTPSRRCLLSSQHDVACFYAPAPHHLLRRNASSANSNTLVC